jgi:MFS family permease
MNPAPSEFRRGWQIVLASAMGVGIGVSGAPFYTLGVFLKPLSAEFGWNRAQLSASTLFLTFGYTLASPIVGRFADRLDVRKIALISLVGLALGFLGLTQINGSIVSLYFGLSVLAVAGCGTSPLIWGHAINSWFDRSRGMALGLALGGGGVAGIIAPRAVDSLIQAYGWQAGYVGLALYALLIVLPVVAIFFRERKLAPEGNARADVSLPGMTVAQAFRSVRFWQLTAGIMCVSGALTAIFIHLIPLMTDAGLPRGEATGIAGILGFALLAGRIGGGYALDRFHAPYVAGILLSIPVLGFLLLAAAPGVVWCFIAATITFGFAAGAEVDLLAYLASRFFGLRAFGAIYGFLLIPYGLGAGIGPLLMGHLYDVTGSYMTALPVAAAVCGAGALAIGALGRYPVFNARNLSGKPAII